MANVYYIGGSPCCGKSAIAELLSAQYHLYYFKVDDFLENYLRRGARLAGSLCAQMARMDAEQTWMRDPKLQAAEELQFYEEIAGFVQEDIQKHSAKGAILAEGAAFLPNLAARLNVPQDHYFALFPTKEFQVSHYLQREWVSYVVQDCSDPQKAFDNWMERDALFAREAARHCREAGYEYQIVDGTQTIPQTLRQISARFHLEI